MPNGQTLTLPVNLEFSVLWRWACGHFVGFIVLLRGRGLMIGGHFSLSPLTQLAVPEPKVMGWGVPDLPLLTAQCIADNHLRRHIPERELDETHQRRQSVNIDALHPELVCWIVPALDQHFHKCQHHAASAAGRFGQGDERLIIEDL